MGLVLGSFLAPETEMIFGDGVGASLVLLPPSGCKRTQGNKQHQDNAFQAFRETNQNLLDLV